MQSDTHEYLSIRDAISRMSSKTPKLDFNQSVPHSVEFKKELEMRSKRYTPKLEKEPRGILEQTLLKKPQNTLVAEI